MSNAIDFNPLFSRRGGGGGGGGGQGRNIQTYQREWITVQDLEKTFKLIIKRYAMWVLRFISWVFGKLLPLQTSWKPILSNRTHNCGMRRNRGVYRCEKMTRSVYH